MFSVERFLVDPLVIVERITETHNRVVNPMDMAIKNEKSSTDTEIHLGLWCSVTIDFVATIMNHFGQGENRTLQPKVLEYSSQIGQCDVRVFSNFHGRHYQHSKLAI